MQFGSPFIHVETFEKPQPVVDKPIVESESTGSTSSSSLSSSSSASSSSSSSSLSSSSLVSPLPSPVPAPVKPKHTQAVATTNVLLVSLNGLEKDATFSTGDPVCCEKCLAIFNKYSKSSASDQLQAAAPGGPGDEIKDGDGRKGNNRQWVCEFCTHENSIAEGDIFSQPTEEQQDYLVSPTPPKEDNKGEDDSIVLFVIDTSGSMSQSQSVKDYKRPVSIKAKLKQQAEEMEKVKPAADAVMNKSSSSLSSSFASWFSKSTTRKQSVIPVAKKEPTPELKQEYVSRLEFVQSAVDAQLAMMSKDYPKRRVGLISFSSEVIYWGDGTLVKPVVFQDEVLKSYDTLMEKGAGLKLETPIAEAHADLQQTLLNLVDTGSTALGPALVLAIAVASQKQGSKIILCTDGCANIGVGDLSAPNPEEFYQQVAHVAKRKGVMVSVISIKGADTKLEFIGNVADITRGAVDLVDPSKLNFGGLLAQNVIAANCRISMYLSPFFALNKFVEELPAEEIKEALAENHDVRDVGNITRDTQVTYEFHATIKGSESLSEAIKANNQASVVFQLHVDYHRMDGAICKRVLTVSRPLTCDALIAQQKLDIRIVSANLAQQCAWLAKAGNYEGALKYATEVKDMISPRVQSDEDKALFAIFTKEYDDIKRTLTEEINKIARIHALKEGRKDNNEVMKEAFYPTQPVSNSSISSNSNSRMNYISNLSESADTEGDMEMMTERMTQRMDYTATKLYNYKQSKQEHCVVQ